MKIVSLNTTKACNLYCKHCYRSSGKDVDTSGELTTDECKDLFRDMKKLDLI